MLYKKGVIIKKLNNKNSGQAHYQICNRSNGGFTLIEIVVVLIIIGILTSIALPNLYNNVVQQRAQEALATIATYRPTIEGCIVKEAGTTDTNCNSTTLGLPSESANFSYSVGAPTAATDTSYVITATGISALAGTDEIVISRAAGAWPAIGAVSCVGIGKLLGVC
jgi:prepilin-type N-terminal cleavage/methylation domain-containing protein